MFRKGEVQQTRNVVYSTYDGSQPFGVFTVYSEGYCNNYYNNCFYFMAYVVWPNSKT